MIAHRYNFNLFLLLCLFSMNCKKEKIYWKLQRFNDKDAKQTVSGLSYKTLDCESLNDFILSNNGSIGGWVIHEGIINNCLKSDFSTTGASIKIIINLDSPTIMQFWTKRDYVYGNRGKDKMENTPELYVNAQRLNIAKIKEKQGWFLFQTETLIKGVLNIEFRYQPDNSQAFPYYYYYLDDINFYYDVN